MTVKIVELAVDGQRTAALLDECRTLDFAGFIDSKGTRDGVHMSAGIFSANGQGSAVRDIKVRGAVPIEVKEAAGDRSGNGAIRIRPGVCFSFNCIAGINHILRDIKIQDSLLDSNVVIYSCIGVNGSAIGIATRTDFVAGKFNIIQIDGHTFIHNTTSANTIFGRDRIIFKGAICDCYCSTAVFFKTSKIDKPNYILFSSGIKCVAFDLAVYYCCIFVNRCPSCVRTFGRFIHPSPARCKGRTSSRRHQR